MSCDRAHFERYGAFEESCVTAEEWSLTAVAYRHPRKRFLYDRSLLVDLESGGAHWFDFETIHESSRPRAWRCADDVRALLVTCLARTIPEERAEVLRLILDVYADERITRILAMSFTPVLQRPLPFHPGQAGLSFHCFRQIARVLEERLGE